jgi:hypothetical protein
MPKSDDICLQPECLAALEKACGFSKADYAEALTNGSNFRTEVWEGRRMLLNPPWHLKNEMAEKLRTDRPSHFVAIVNKSATGNMTNLMAAAGLDPIALTPQQQEASSNATHRRVPSNACTHRHSGNRWRTSAQQPTWHVATKLWKRRRRSTAYDTWQNQEQRPAC